MGATHYRVAPIIRFSDLLIHFPSFCFLSSPYSSCCGCPCSSSCYYGLLKACSLKDKLETGSTILAESGLIDVIKPASVTVDSVISSHSFNCHFACTFWIASTHIERMANIRTFLRCPYKGFRATYRTFNIFRHKYLLPLWGKHTLECFTCQFTFLPCCYDSRTCY